MEEYPEPDKNRKIPEKKKPIPEAVSNVLNTNRIGKGGPEHTTEGFGNIENPKDFSYLD